ncbi:MAG: hypothetical protein II458_06500 [Oscillospiraceae bacterium]|nr:hypothetical protein [Oscillospiraceae bacterium]
MAELEDRLNALLSDPDSMAQVMQMAQQLSATMGQSQPAGSAPPAPSAPSAPAEGLDPKLLTRLLPLVREYSQSSSQTMNLLMALRPFLKPEKQEKVARAAQLSHLIHIGKKFLLERRDEIV